MMADVGSLQRLPYLLPDAVLRQMAFCGTTLRAAQAEALGFMNGVSADPLAAALAAAARNRAPGAAGGDRLEAGDRLCARAHGGREAGARGAAAIGDLEHLGRDGGRSPRALKRPLAPM